MDQQRFFELTGARGEASGPIKNHAGAVKNQFILPADEIAIEERGIQDAGGLGEGEFTDRQLVPEVGRCGKIDQGMKRSLLKQSGRHFFREPGILADVKADAQAVHIKDQPRFPGGEVSFFIKNAVVGQQHFAVDALYFSARQNGGGISHGAFHPVRNADDGDHLGRQFSGQLAEQLFAVVQKSVFQDEIFRRVPGDGQLGKDSDAGGLFGGPKGVVPDFSAVAFEISHGGIDLGQSDGD